jgi:hypothetical protein
MRPDRHCSATADPRGGVNLAEASSGDGVLVQPPPGISMREMGPLFIVRLFLRHAVE